MPFFVPLMDGLENRLKVGGFGGEFIVNGNWFAFFYYSLNKTMTF